jgi:hypothetical protein
MGERKEMEADRWAGEWRSIEEERQMREGRGRGE